MKKIIIVVLTLSVLLISYIFIPKTNINYDMTTYLPSDAMTTKGIDILEDEFGKSSMIQIMVLDIDVNDLLNIKEDLYLIDYVSQVIWLDDYVDLEVVPIEFIDASIKGPFYQNQDALLTVTFSSDAYDINLEDSIEDIEFLFSDYEIYMRGEILVNKESRDIAQGETFKIMFLIVPVVIVLLILSSHAWIEPVLILITLGIAILFNLITNGLLPHVSFITETMSLALQLALSIDYAIFMIHRYYEERESHDAHQAARLSLKHSIKPIATSALTTIAGFAALTLMKFTIGLDIAVVLSKGIIFSFLMTVILMPILLIWFDKLILKTKHKMFVPPFKHLVRFELKIKYVLVVLFVLCAGLGFIMQRNTDYLYGATSVGGSGSDVGRAEEMISDTFGENVQLVILFPNETVSQEVDLSNDLLALDTINSVSALVLTVDPNIPREFLPAELVNQYVGTSYSRIIITTSIYEEDDALFDFIETLNSIVKSHYDEYYFVGQSAAIVDIKSSIANQGTYLMLLTVLGVGLIVGFIFKSIKIPIILLTVILTAIWINLGILTFTNIKVLYIGYLVVMSIQLGATIDYAVLLTHRYLEESVTEKKEKAIEIAFTKSSLSMMVSGVILLLAGFIEGLFSNIDSVTKIGYLLGRGVLISLVCILLFLPVLLYLFIKPKNKD
jgi:predicted RND superfamily exporter protein